MKAALYTKIEAAKKEYRKAYLRERQREFRAKYRSVTVSFLKKEATELEAYAKLHELKLSDFVKACVFAYLNQGFIIPNNDKIQRLELLLLRIGNNVTTACSLIKLLKPSENKS